MVIKWIKGRKRMGCQTDCECSWVVPLLFVVFMIFLITKFNQVWPILIFLPIVVIGFLKIRMHYRDIAEQLRSNAMIQDMPIVDKNLALVPISSITSAVDKSIYYAQMIANDVIAVHVSFGIKMKHVCKINGKLIFQIYVWLFYVQNIVV